MKKATFCKLKTSLSGNFVYNLFTNILGILSSAFFRVTGANQDARKLLLTDLVKTNYEYLQTVWPVNSR